MSLKTLNINHINRNKYLIIIPDSPQGFRDNLQHCLGDFARLIKVLQFTNDDGMSNDAPIHECESNCVSAGCNIDISASVTLGLDIIQV